MSTITRSRIGPAVAALLLAAATAACGINVSSPPADVSGGPSVLASIVPPTPSIAVPTPTPVPSGASSLTAIPTPVPDSPDLAAARVAVEPVATGFTQPLFVTSAGDGSGRLFVLEQGGRIRIVRDGQVLATPFLDISGRVLSGGERGLLGLAFPPGFGTDRTAFFVDYTNAQGNTTVSEFRLVPGSPDVADPASERIVLTVTQPYANHNGGWIGFDPGGMLLIAMGDGGSGGDPQNRASSLESLLGKMLRIDVLGAPTGTAYGIPADNPFSRRATARPEILDYGLRNPFRDSVDAATGDLWIGDVGQSAWEEVDVARAGARGLDFGWRRWEGLHCYNPSTGCDPAGVTAPVAEYPHPTGCAIIGGVVYRGAAIPALRGGYLFSDYCSGTLWAIDAGSDATQTPVTLAQTGFPVSSIGTGEDGEVYLTDLGGGRLVRLVSGG